MLNLKKIGVFIVFVAILFQPSFGFEIKKVFKKKPRPEKTRMVETEEEWQEEAQNIPVKQRELNGYTKPESTDTYYNPTPKYRFEKYNYPAGSKEVDLSEIKAKNVIYSPLVADISCRFAAYSKFYLSPDINQIASNFYVVKLDTSKIKTKRMADFNPLSVKDEPVIQAGTKDLYPNLFQGLTLVDWNAKSNLLLIKEKIGSTLGGIYKTVLYIHDFANGETAKLTGFDKAMRDYFLDYENIQMQKYRYEILPLGFSSENDNIILVNVYLFDINNNRIFMGIWGYNYSTNEVLFVSKTAKSISISANGLILKQVVD